MTDEEIKEYWRTAYCNEKYKKEQLEKENAELKADNLEWEKTSDKWKSVYELTNNQLTKAKELLAKWVELFKPKGGNIPPTPIQVDTEQFLKE